MHRFTEHVQYIFIDDHCFTVKVKHQYFFLQVIENIPDYKSYYRERTKGSWTLSNGENFWPIADTTAEALKVIFFTNTKWI